MHSHYAYETRVADFGILRTSIKPTRHLVRVFVKRNREKTLDASLDTGVFREPQTVRESQMLLDGGEPDDKVPEPEADSEEADATEEAARDFGDGHPLDNSDSDADEIETADAVKAAKTRLVETADGRVVRRSERPDDVRFVSLGTPERSRRDGVEIVNGVVPWRPDRAGKSRDRQHDDAVRAFLGKPKKRRETPVGTIALARQLRATGLSYAKVGAALAVKGHRTGTGRPYTASAIQKMFGESNSSSGCWIGGNWWA